MERATTEGKASVLARAMAKCTAPPRTMLMAVVLLLAQVACAPAGRTQGGERPDGSSALKPERVRPGISVLMSDSIHLIKDKRVGLITNQTGVDEKGNSSVDLLFADDRAKAANVQLVALFSPEHGIRGTEDRANLPSETDAATGLTVHSLYQRSTIAPPDSTLKNVEVLLVDLQDIGTRTWTYVGVMLYAMQAADRLGIPFVVLDRPNPLGLFRAEGALLDTAIADAREGTVASPRNGFSLWPLPLRHGLTMGEMALLFHKELNLTGRMYVVPVAGLRRDMWFDDTDLPWVKPSPNLPTLTSALLYPALVPFEGTNVSVGRGTNEPFERLGAPWLKADSVVALLRTLELSGVRFETDRFTPQAPGDGKFAGTTVAGVRIRVTERDRIQVARVGAALLWAIGRVNPTELQFTPRRVDERLGSAAMREALLAGDDPDRVLDRMLPSIVAYERAVRPYRLYR